MKTLGQAANNGVRVVCISKRIGHHSKSGGYDRFTDYIGTVNVSGPSLQTFSGKVASKLWDAKNRKHLHHDNYGLADRIAEEVAFWAAWRNRAQIVHALYGEEQLHALLPRLGLLRRPLVATFHLPLTQARSVFSRVPDATMRRLAGVVVVGSGEVAGFDEWLGPGKTVFVPHGIDTTAFHPAPFQPAPKARFLFVGWHMRDFQTAHRAMDLAASAGLDLQLDVVVRRDKYAFFTACPNVNFHSGLSEAELLRMYQEADALFLPLLDATANNSVLEALACGTPVITNDVGSIRDYVDESCGWLLPPGDADAAFACLASIVADRAVAMSRRAGARAKAERLAWPVVSADLKRCYARLLQSGRFAP